jgi:fatty acid desaturase
MRGWAAVIRNLGPYVLLLAAAPLLYAWHPLAAWLLAPLLGLFSYRITIVMHDCIHRSLFTSSLSNDRAGTLLGDVTGIDFYSFRRQHLRHHRLYGRPGDPEGFQYLGMPRSGRAFAWHLLKPLLGVNLRYALPESLLRPRNLLAAARRGNLLALATIQLAILALVTGNGEHPWLAVLPFASAATFGLFFSQLRGIAEHGAAGASRVRSHEPNWIDRTLLYDLDFNYHAEHHLHPSVPSRDLAALRDPARPAPASMFLTLHGLSR